MTVKHLESVWKSTWIPTSWSKSGGSLRRISQERSWSL